MKSKFIKISGISDVVTLARQASLVNGDVILYHDRWVIDAKSLMGIMSIDVSKGATIEYPDDAEFFDNFISTFEVKEEN